MSCRVAGWVLLAVSMMAALPGLAQPSSPAGGPATPAPEPEIVFEELPPFGYTRHIVEDRYGRSIESYLSQAPDAEPRPLVVFVQGSGCVSVFGLTDSGQVYGGLQNLIFRDFGDRVRVLVVEKPGVAFADTSARPGSGEGCSEEFFREHTVERWTEALRAAIEHATTQPGVDPDRVLILGHSEGADMAAHVAAAAPELVSHVAVLSGAGVTQLFDMMRFAERPQGEEDTEEARNDRVQEVVATWRRIAADPDSTQKTAWGHPYRRWSSFMRASPAASLERIIPTTPMFLAHGTADESCPVESFDAAVAQLLVAGATPEIRRVAGADHGFAKVGAEGSPGHGIEGLSAIINEAVEWFLSDPQP